MHRGNAVYARTEWVRRRHPLESTADVDRMVSMAGGGEVQQAQRDVGVESGAAF